MLRKIESMTHALLCFLLEHVCAFLVLKIMSLFCSSLTLALNPNATLFWGLLVTGTTDLLLLYHINTSSLLVIQV